jgi:hypothetical protein
MSRLPQLSTWQQQLATRFPALSGPVVAVLALYSFGLLLAKTVGLTTVAFTLAQQLGRQVFGVQKRLSEFYKEADAKSGVKQGQKRRDFDITTCFAPLLRWVLTLWSGRHLPLALDVTNLGDRFHVLCVSVMIRGTGIPIAWKVLAGGEPDAWNPYWNKLLRGLQGTVPAEWTVVVLSDRGLESPALFDFIKALGWHPLMRIKKGAKFRPLGWRTYHPLLRFLPQVGTSFYRVGDAYVSTQMPCTLLAHWAAGYDEPWLVLTTLPPDMGHVLWYAYRSWIEQGFKVIKGGQWEWQNTRMDDPARVERLWLVLAVATLWVVALGADAEVQEAQAQEQQRLDELHRTTDEQRERRQEQEQQRRAKQEEALRAKRARDAAKRARREAQPTPKKAVKQARKASRTGRRQSVVARGLAVLSALWLAGATGLPQQLHPEPWPPPCHPISVLTEAEFLTHQT